MGLKVIEHEFNGTTTPYTSYNSSLTNLGKLVRQNTGTTKAEKYVGTVLSPMGLVRIQEMMGVAAGNVYSIDCQNGRHCIFIGDASGAGVTRRIGLVQWIKSTDTLNYLGYINVTFPTATNHTMRGMAVARHTYSTGTVTVASTSVTGSGTAWQTNRFAVGARIGFGTTDPAQVTQWYQITAIGSDTSITIQSPTTVAGGSSFVIEELRIYIATTNATAANGGLYVVKGVSEEDFIHAGTTIPAAVSTDNIKACYFLKDAATNLNTVACGVALDTTQSDTSHFVYVVNADAGTTARIYKHDGRAALTVASGASTSSFVFRTGQQSTSGNIQNATSTSLSQNAVMATTSHGTGNGIKSLYFLTTTRLYRCDDTAITNGGTTFLTDNMAELPPGGTNTFALSNALTALSYCTVLDRFIITTTGFRDYITKYISGTTTRHDYIWGTLNPQLYASTSDLGSTHFANAQIQQFTWCTDGMMYCVGWSATVGYNLLTAIPLGADMGFASGNGVAANQSRVIFPKFVTTGCKKFYRIADNDNEYVGSSALGLLTESHNYYYRTTGIDDDTGEWNPFDHYLFHVPPASQIQFMIEFRTIGPFCLSKRVYNFVLGYEDGNTDSHYEPSTKHSDVINKRFAWHQCLTFYGIVPTLEINLYDAATGSLLLTDNTAHPSNGIWEKSIDDGVTWADYDNTDMINEITYIRYTPTSLTDDIRVLALLTQSHANLRGVGGSNLSGEAVVGFIDN